MSEIEEVGEELEASWSEAEFSSVHFRNKRLKKRLVKIAAESLQQATNLSVFFRCFRVKIAAESLQQPLATINQASEDWADAKAAYRFFANQKVTSEDILSPHSSRTRERMKG